MRISKVLCAAFLYLQFGFVIFWRKDYGAKAAHKMLVKLTKGQCYRDECDAKVPQKMRHNYFVSTYLTLFASTTTSSTTATKFVLTY